MPLEPIQVSHYHMVVTDVFKATSAAPHGVLCGLRARVAAAACLAAVTTAVLVWAEDNGARELPDLIDEGFIALRHGLG